MSTSQMFYVKGKNCYQLEVFAGRVFASLFPGHEEDYVDTQIAFLLEVGGANELALRMQVAHPHPDADWTIHNWVVPCTRSNYKGNKGKSSQQTQMWSAFCIVYPTLHVQVLRYILSNLMVLSSNEVIDALISVNETTQL